MLWQQLKVQCRVIGALLIREIVARYGRIGLGAGWVVAEPLTFALPVLLLWDAVRSPFQNGIALMPLLWSGYMPILLFRHIGGRMLFFIRSNSGLMFHRPVTILDIFVSRCALEIAENLASAIVVYLVFYFLGALEAPRDLPMLFVGYFYMIWWCAVVALMVGALSERSEWVEKIWQPYAYTYLFFGGMWYMADWLSPTLRTLALYQPSLQAYEMIRAGLLGNTVKTYYDFSYTAFVLGLLTFIGLAALRDGRRYVIID